MVKKLSVIIVSYNTKDLLRQCLDSIRKNLGDKSAIEIIVVDNGSLDGSLEAVRNFQFSNPNFQTRLIENKTNLGFAKANNQGIKAAKGEYLLLLNSDTIVRREAFRELIDFAGKTPDVGVVGAKLLNPDGSVQPSCYHFPSLKSALEEFWFGKEGSFSKYAPKTKQPTEVDAVVGAAFLIPRKTVKRIGLLDESYFMYFEDLAYCRKAKEAGLKIYYLPSVEIVHFHGQSGKKLLTKPSQWLEESSKKYHGVLIHYLINLIIWSGQKCQKLKNCFGQLSF